MRYLLLLLTCFISPAYASAVICPDGITYTDSAANKCPAYRTGIGVTAITDTTAFVSGSADAQSVGATAYHYTSSSAYPPGCTEISYVYDDLSSGVIATRQIAERARQKCMNWKTMVAGTGASSYGSAAISAAGSFNVPITGLSPSTSLYAHEFFIGGLGGNKVSLMTTLPFTTIASSTPTTALTGLQRYIKDDGSNGNDGLTDATAKQTLAAGCPGSLQAGTDCNLKTGDTWSERMTIAHAGLANNYSVIRCYKMVSGSPYECETGDTKPILLGTMDQTKLTAGTEDYRTSNFVAEGLGEYGEYLGQYTISATADYTEHKYIAIRNARHIGILITGNTPSPSGVVGTGDLHHVKLTGMTTYNTMNSPVVVLDSVSDLVVRDGDYGFYNTCEMQIRQGGTNTDICNSGGWPGGLVMSRGVARALWENNDVHNGFGEGSNCYANYATASIFRGNTFVNLLSGGTYIDICSDLVVENNIYVGNRGAVNGIGYASGTAGQWGGMPALGWEDFNLPNPYSSDRIVVRNNLIVGTGACVDGSPETLATQGGRYNEYKYFGNTCVDPYSYGIDHQYAITGYNSVRMVAKNNVIWSDNSAASVCQIPGSAVTETFLDNHWDPAPSDTDCVAAGDTTGAPGLTVSTYATWEAYAYGNMPTFANAAPTGGAAIKDTCTNLTGAMLTAESYGFALDNIDAALAAADPAAYKANWVLENYYDANDTVRGATCSKGAVE